MRYTKGGACVECMRQYRGFYKNGTLLAAKSSEEIKNSVQTCVYVVSAGPYVKVGLAENLAARVATIQNGCPLPVKVEHVCGPMPRLEARRLEQKCFRDLSASHERGEWYRCSVADVLRVIGSDHPAPRPLASPAQLRVVA